MIRYNGRRGREVKEEVKEEEKGDEREDCRWRKKGKKDFYVQKYRRKKTIKKSR